MTRLTRMFLIFSLLLSSFSFPVLAEDMPENQPRIAGNFQTLLGESADWSPSTSRIFLTDADQDGIYDITFPLDRGSDYQFKVIEGNDWSFPNHGNPDGSNKTFAVAKSGSTVTVQFNGESKAIDVTVKEGTGSDDNLPKPNDIAWDELLHDSHEQLFRKPFGAIATDAEATLRLQTKADDVENITLSYWDELAKVRKTAPMKKAGFAYLNEKTKVDFWETSISSAKPTVLRYHFILQDGTKTVYYGDTNDGNGGVGAPSNNTPAEYQLTVHDKNFKTPDWMKNSIVYQIFPDRFHNGDTSNDKAADERGSRGAMPIEHKAWNEIPIDNPNLIEKKFGRAVFDDRNNDGYPDFDANKDGQKDFSFVDLDKDGKAEEVDLNENGVYDKYVDYKGDGLWHNDFFGGDIVGVTKQLDYIEELGIKTIYLNPIFEASSAHKYDTSDYEQLDRMFGTNEEFQTFAKEAQKRGITIILDGVFNHVGDDSRYFDRYGKYYNDIEYWQLNGKDRNQNIGAYQAWRMKQKAAGNLTDPNVPAWDDSLHFSPYADWFTIKADGTYESWWGFDSLPVVKTVDGSELNLKSFADYMIRNDDSIARRWIEAGSSGWRLDVAPEVAHDFWKAFRDYTKGSQKGDMKHPNGEPIILTENWGDATVDLLGDSFDTTMNYRFRNAVIDFILDEGFNDTDIMHNPIDAKGLDARLTEIAEDYPAEAFYAMMNLLGSHDTMRIKRVFGDIEPQFLPEAERAKLTDTEIQAANDRAMKRLVLASIMQMGYPGAPSIYYGDEAGQTGWDDPENRRPFPTDSANGDLLTFFAQLNEIRNKNQVLKTGTLETLYAEGHTYAIGRKITGGVDALGNKEYRDTNGKKHRVTDAAAVVIASKEGGSMEIPVASFVRDGAVFTDALAPDTKYVVENGTLTIELGQLEGKILIADKKLTPPVAVKTIQAISTNETGKAGEVTVTWGKSKFARSYNVYRSTVADGYQVKVGETAGNSFVDTHAENGIRYFYTVAAVDKEGNESDGSKTVAALPYIAIDHVGDQTSSAADNTHEIGTAKAVTIQASVTVDKETASDKALPYVQAKLTVESATGAKLEIPATFAESKDGKHYYQASFIPDELGNWHYAMSFTTNQGEAWTSIDEEMVKVVADPADTTAPEAPELVQPQVEANRVELNWTVDTDATIVYYEVFRDGKQLARLTKDADTKYVDLSVQNQTEYRYYVVAVDQAFNRAKSNEISIMPDLVLVQVTFNVQVPANTPKDPINIAGSFQGWNPGSADHLLYWDEAEQVFRVTFPFELGTKFEYKFARGAWTAVEKDANGGEVNNRVLTVENQGGNKMVVEQTVESWADLPRP